MQSPSSVDLLDLAAAALASSVTASRPIRKLAQQAVGVTPRENARLKLDGSVVTDADGAAQQIIVGALMAVSTKIRIVGEESSGDMDNSHTRSLNFEKECDAEKELEEKVFQLAREQVLQRFSENPTNSTMEIISESIEPNPLHYDAGSESESRGVCNVKASRVSAFVDPLDGTSCYAKGEYEAVTILVAIIVDNVPVFGVICKPFGQEGQNSILDSGCFAVFGGILINGAYIAGGGECGRSKEHRQEAPDNGEEESDLKLEASRRAIISRSRAGGVVRKCIDSLSGRGLLHPDPVLVSGAGAKTLRLICGDLNETLWFFPKPGTSLWDVAAADALLRAIGGRLSDKDGNDMDYSRSRHDAENNDGIVACSSSALHVECIRLFQLEKWTDDD
mmetsp:Transcript_17405/g.32418  ORF Transcript_17405/g.32418 Transcript_17405/m.32418 type:complete len:392 (-) Transcript_17405:42-1217(-)